MKLVALRLDRLESKCSETEARLVEEFVEVLVVVAPGYLPKDWFCLKIFHQ
jgi:hypothetical protein